MQFKACLKKEFLETIRTKKFYINLGLAIFISILSVVYVIIMSIIKEYLPVENLGPIARFFEKSYLASINFFASFIISYFLLLTVFYNCAAISKPIGQKQWVLPINSGMKPGILIGAKIIMEIFSAVFCLIISFILHGILTVIFCNPGTILFQDFLISYLFLTIGIIFALILTITLNAITKKRWVPVVTVLILVMIVTNVLESIVIGGESLVSYTPLAFFAFSGIPSLDLWQWLTSLLSTFLLCAGLIIWSALSNKIKAERPIEYKSIDFKKLIKKND